MTRLKIHSWYFLGLRESEIPEFMQAQEHTTHFWYNRSFKSLYNTVKQKLLTFKVKVNLPPLTHQQLNMTTKHLSVHCDLCDQVGIKSRNLQTHRPFTDNTKRTPACNPILSKIPNPTDHISYYLIIYIVIFYNYHILENTYRNLPL